jgi:hypothetical protein
MTDKGQDAVNALSMVRDAQRKIAERAKAPSYYHPALGVVFLMLCGSFEIERGTPLITIAMCLLTILIVRYKEHTGMWLNGLTAGGRRSKGLMWMGSAVIIIGLFGGLALRSIYELHGIMWAVGIVIGIFVTWLGFAWERAFLEDAGAGK